MVDQAMTCFRDEPKKEEIREALKAGALARAEEDVEVAEEFFPAEQEVWDSQLKDEVNAGTPYTPERGREPT